MERLQWEERIVTSPELRHGEPCITGTRIPVALILGSLADGLSPDDVRETYPQLTHDDIRAALAYAADALRFEWVSTLP